MPLAKPTIMAVAVLTFTDYWSDFISRCCISNRKAATRCRSACACCSRLDQTNWPILMAAAVIMTVPVIVMFLIVQRYFWPEGRLAGMVGRVAD